MLNPIKRVWVPKKPDAAPTPPEMTLVPIPAVDVQPAESTAGKRGILFEELPEPEVSEKFSDSVWAEFETALPQVHSK